MNKVRVRYAPSPTGYLHIGGARSALFNYLYAKQNNGDFVFRIEDTDIERNIPGAEESQYYDMIWLGIIPDESPYKPVEKYGPYKQTEKLELYRKYAQQLVDMGYAYECFCTEDELAQMKEEQLSNGIKSFKYDRRCLNLTKEEKEKLIKEGRKPSIRLKMEANVEFKFHDLVRGDVKFSSNDIGDFVIMKSNGIPTYNFAVVIDDHLMEISHVFRGEEHLSNTPKQLQIYKYFNWEPPQFGHMTIIINENGKKLSKRDHNIIQFVSQYRENGYLPEAIDNFLLLLGWTPSSDKEIFSLDEAIKEFSTERLSCSPSMFDASKLKWMNAYYIRHLDEEKYKEFISPFIKNVPELKSLSEEKQFEIAKIFQNEISTGKEIEEQLQNIFAPSFNFTKEQKTFINSEKSKIVLNEFLNLIDEITLTPENVKKLFKDIQLKTGIKGKELYMPIRMKLTGSEHGIEMFNIIDILGKEEVKTRIKYN